MWMSCGPSKSPHFTIWPSPLLSFVSHLEICACGCNVDVMWNIVEECESYVEDNGGMWMFFGAMWMSCGPSTSPNFTIWPGLLPSLVSHLKICDCGCNVEFPHRHVDSWVDSRPFCSLYSSMHLLSVSWSCILYIFCTRALALLYNVSLEALKAYAFAKSLGLVSQDHNSNQRHNFIASNILRLFGEFLVPQEGWKASEQLLISSLAYYYLLKRRNEKSRLVNIFK